MSKYGFSAETKPSTVPSRPGFAAASRSRKRTPAQWTFFTDQPVTQWKFETCSARGSFRRSWYVRLCGFSTRPSMRKRHVCGSKLGIDEATV